MVNYLDRLTYSGLLPKLGSQKTGPKFKSRQITPNIIFCESDGVITTVWPTGKKARKYMRTDVIFVLFTEQEIALMRRIGLTMDLENPYTLSSDEWILIEETVGDRLVLHELDENYEPTPDGVICEDILEKVARH